MTAPPVTRASERGVVLVVDDAPDSLRMLIDALEDSKLSALVAKDADAALALLERVTPDVILLDAVMPGMDGFTLCAEIKRRPANLTTPVLFMTGLSETADIVRGFQAGGVDYLVKPINPLELIARVSAHIANARMIADARAALEATGDSVFSISADGAVLWMSSAAQTHIAARDDDAARGWIASNARIRSWLRAAAGHSIVAIEPVSITLPAGDPATLRLVGRGPNGDLIVRVTATRPSDASIAFVETFGLSEREADVLVWLAQGKTNDDIATILKISQRTVSKHVESILNKLGAENRTAAAIKAVKAGL